MSQRLLPLLLLTGLTTFAMSSAANAASFSSNMNIRSTGPGSSGQTTTVQMGGRPPGYGYGQGYNAPPAGAPYGGPRPPRLTVFNSNDQFDTNGNLNPGGGGGSVKPSKSPAHQ